MTQVDFYLVDGTGAAPLGVACRIADKAMQQDQGTYIRVGTDAEVDELDSLLWTFAQGSFVPHRRLTPTDTLEPAPEEPVLIGTHDVVAGQGHAILINLTTQFPTDAESFLRIAEVIDSDPEHRQQARERYRRYRELGAKLATHQV